MRIGIVLGTRPEIMKNCSVVKALSKRGIPFFVLHTNQHSDYRMQGNQHSDYRMQGGFFEQMGYQADCVFPHKYQIGQAIDWVREMIRKLRLDLIIVNGDTAAALVGGIAAVYADAGLAHIEAGLRSYDKEMYEERNRIMVDALSHYLFTYTKY